MRLNPVVPRVPSELLGVCWAVCWTSVETSGRIERKRSKNQYKEQCLQDEGGLHCRPLKDIRARVWGAPLPSLGL